MPFLPPAQLLRASGPAAAAGGDTMHVLYTSNGSPYLNYQASWQARFGTCWQLVERVVSLGTAAPNQPTRSHSFPVYCRLWHCMAAFEWHSG